jgi:hypothetical protein
MSTIEELLGRKNSGSGLESRKYGRKASHWQRGTLYSHKLTSTSNTECFKRIFTMAFQMLMCSTPWTMDALYAFKCKLFRNTCPKVRNFKATPLVYVSTLLNVLSLCYALWYVVSLLDWEIWSCNSIHGGHVLPFLCLALGNASWYFLDSSSRRKTSDDNTKPIFQALRLPLHLPSPILNWRLGLRSGYRTRKVGGLYEAPIDTSY